MKTKHIFSLFFSAIFCLSFGQKKEEKKWEYKPNFMVGVDALNFGTSFFSDRKLYQGFISSRINKNVHAVIDAGFDKNIYDKSGYDADVKGVFVKVGGFYMLAKDSENDFNGFYAGGKLGASFYNQEYSAVPIRGFGGNTSSIAYPSTSQSSYWIEGTLGGRVQLFDSQFFIDVNMQPRYLLFTTKQDDIFPMVIPGFGRSSNKFGVGFAWNLAYKF